MPFPQRSAAQNSHKYFSLSAAQVHPRHPPGTEHRVGYEGHRCLLPVSSGGEESPQGAPPKVRKEVNGPPSTPTKKSERPQGNLLATHLPLQLVEEAVLHLLHVERIAEHLIAGQDVLGDGERRRNKKAFIIRALQTASGICGRQFTKHGGARARLVDKHFRGRGRGERVSGSGCGWK